MQSMSDPSSPVPTANKQVLPPSSPTLKATSSVYNVQDEKPPFGSRFLTETSDVWSQNAWDHVPPPSDQDDLISTSLAKQRSQPVPHHEHARYNEHPQRHWDRFYQSNTANFFKDRKWLANEFPELVHALSPQAGPKIIAELGCGAGNAVFPLYANNQNPEALFKAYDYSVQAVKLVQQHPLYQEAPSGKISASVWDLSSDAIPQDLEGESVDIIVLVFVLSALHPDEWAKAISNIYRLLKPGGMVLLRDYGRYDLTQLRFKTGRMLADNFYIRGDSTRVYFFEIDELSLLFSGSESSVVPTIQDTVEGAEDDDNPLPIANTSTTQGVHSEVTSPGAHTHPCLTRDMAIPYCPPHPLFSVERLGVDRRLIVNRSRRLKMHRVWMQGVFKKQPVVST